MWTVVITRCSFGIVCACLRFCHILSSCGAMGLVIKICLLLFQFCWWSFPYINFTVAITCPYSKASIVFVVKLMMKIVPCIIVEKYCIFPFLSPLQVVHKPENLFDFFVDKCRQHIYIYIYISSTQQAELH